VATQKTVFVARELINKAGALEAHHRNVFLVSILKAVLCESSGNGRRKKSSRCIVSETPADALSYLIMTIISEGKAKNT
jgi:hypothetical protein